MGSQHRLAVWTCPLSPRARALVMPAHPKLKDHSQTVPQARCSSVNNRPPLIRGVGRKTKGSWQIPGKGLGHPAPQGRNPNSSGCQPGERPGSERPDPVRVEPGWESSQSVRPFQGRITVGRGFRGLHPRLFTLNPSGIAGPSSVLPALFSPTLAEPRKSAMNQTKRDGVGRRPSGVVACEARPSLAWPSRRPSSRCS